MLLTNSSPGATIFVASTAKGFILSKDSDVLIDFEMLRKLSEQYPETSLMRPAGVPSNALGFLAIDPMDVDHGLHIALQAGQVVEQDRGGAGFNPNTIAFVWPADQLSLDGLITVARNQLMWNQQNQ